MLSIRIGWKRCWFFSCCTSWIWRGCICWRVILWRRRLLRGCGLVIMRWAEIVKKMNKRSKRIYTRHNKCISTISILGSISGNNMSKWSIGSSSPPIANGRTANSSNKPSPNNSTSYSTSNKTNPSPKSSSKTSNLPAIPLKFNGSANSTLSPLSF